MFGSDYVQSVSEKLSRWSECKSFSFSSGRILALIQYGSYDIKLSDHGWHWKCIVVVKHKTNNLNIEPKRIISKLHDLTQGDPLKSRRTTLFVDNIDQQLKYRLYLAMLPWEFKFLWMNLTVVSSRLIRSSRNLYQQNYSVQYGCLLPGNLTSALNPRGRYPKRIQ